MLPLLLFVSVIPLNAKRVQYKAQEVNQVDGPISRAFCLPCPNFPCPSCGGSITGGTGQTGATGICPISPTGNVVPATFPCLDAGSAFLTSVSTECQVVQDDLIVTLNADIKDNASICRDLRGANDACIGQELAVGQDATIDGNTVILGRLTVNDSTIINDSLFNNGNATVTGSLSITGSATVNDLNVQGNATFAGLLTATGGLSVFNGQVIQSGGLLITGCIGTGCTGAIISGNVCINGDETVTGDKFVEELTVDQLATLNNVTIGTGVTGRGMLVTNDFVTMNDGLTIAAGNQVIRTGNLTLSSGDLFVNNPAAISNFIGAVTANNGAIISGGVIVNDGQSVETGDLNVLLGNGSIEGTLTVNGSITGLGAATLNTLTITDQTNSLSPTGPAALVVNGGAGIAKDIWIGGDQYFTNVIAEGGTPCAFNYYEESCFSTTFTWAGVTTTPSASVLIHVVRVGNLVNLIIPPIILNNPGRHIDVIKSFTPLPQRFRPFTTVRGAASTIVYNAPAPIVLDPPVIIGQLGEFDVSPAGIITLGLPGAALGPQRIDSIDFVMADANTITYSIDGCDNTCKMPSFD